MCTLEQFPCGCTLVDLAGFLSISFAVLAGSAMVIIMTVDHIRGKKNEKRN